MTLVLSLAFQHSRSLGLNFALERSLPLNTVCLETLASLKPVFQPTAATARQLTACGWQLAYQTTPWISMTHDVHS